MLLLLGIIQYALAILVRIWIEQHQQERGYDEEEYSEKDKLLYYYFGTLTDTMLTLSTLIVTDSAHEVIRLVLWKNFFMGKFPSI